LLEPCLRDVLASDGNVTTHLDATALERLFDPMDHGASNAGDRGN
jgi:hypothetical protein